jgi:tripartite-type tricarboxylate transporter receptor subunit TctC
VPTIAEAGVPGYEAVTWGGIVAPAGMPKKESAKWAAVVRHVGRSSTSVSTRVRNDRRAQMSGVVNTLFAAAAT